ncbi:MAG: sulfite oxidase-like oxidoreductase [Anaerolineales bacterium]|nr:sulfite oxidase-like oxidoreductase [Anaerolineales bacterium]
MLNKFNSRKDEEQKMRSEGRLPPGQSLTDKFPVLHYGSIPRVDLATWNFRIYGAVAKEITWSWEEFNQLPKTEIQLDIHCVTRWSKFNTTWGGVSVKSLLNQSIIQLKPEAQYVMQHAEQGFTANLPLSVISADNFLLATHYDGEPISLDHGYPLRGVIGQIMGVDNLAVPYFWKGAKWLRALEFRDTDKPGFWEQAGYHNEADVWKEQRFS